MPFHSKLRHTAIRLSPCVCVYEIVIVFIDSKSVIDGK